MCIVQLYFVRRQAFSVAVSKAGLSVGVLFWSDFAHFAIAKYGYRGALLLMAGVNLHGYVIAAIFRAPNFKMKTEPCREVPLKADRNGGYLICNPNDNPSIEIQNVGRSPVAKIEINHNCETEKQYSDITEFGKNTSHEYNDSVSGSEPISLKRNGTLSNGVCRTLGPLTADDDNTENIGIGKEEPHLSLTGNGCDINANVDVKFVNKKDTYKVHRNCKKVGDVLGNIIDISLLKIPTFSLFCLTIFFGDSSNTIPYYFIPMRVSAMGIPKHSTAMLITYLGIAGAIGRILTGWVGDQPWADRKLMYACSHTVAGCISFIAYFISDYNALIAYCALFATTSGRGHSIRICSDHPSFLALVDWLTIVLLNGSKKRYECFISRHLIQIVLRRRQRPVHTTLSIQWASYQIRKIAGCACAGMPGTFSPTADFKGNH